MPMRRTLFLLVLTLSTTPFDALGDEREMRMEEMQRRAAELVATSKGGKSATFQATPLFRYHDPIRRVVDATVWSLGSLKVSYDGTKFWSVGNQRDDSNNYFSKRIDVLEK